MKDDRKEELKSFLKVLPPVDFCCVYGSSLHPNNRDKVRKHILVVLDLLSMFTGLVCCNLTISVSTILFRHL